MKFIFRLSSCLILLLVSIVVALQLGAVQLHWSEIFSATPLTSVPAEIFWQLRLPRVLLAGLAGAALGVCGALLQLLSRNALADPYLFGVVSGAALGATASSVWLPQLALPVSAPRRPPWYAKHQHFAADRPRGVIFLQRTGQFVAVSSR